MWLRFCGKFARKIDLMKDQPDPILTIKPNFRGCILRTRSGRTLLQQASDEAERAKRIPNQLTKQFQTASAGKGFVDVGIMQLIVSDQLLMTERLLIRRFRASDGLDLYEYLSDETVVYYEPYETYSEEQARQEAIDRAGHPSFYAVCLRNNGKLIGNLYLGGSDFDTWELGYVFNRQYHNQGYATESAKALLQYAFDHLGARRIIASCALENHASWHLLERLGMRREGLQLQNIWFKRNRQGEPQWLDSCLYAILKSEWRQD